MVPHSNILATALANTQSTLATALANTQSTLATALANTQSTLATAQQQHCNHLGYHSNCIATP